MVWHYLARYLHACWDILVAMGVYIGFGFLMAGILHIFVNPQMIVKYLGKGRIKSVLYAATLGVPLPLCSCGVLPTTAGLKKQGANNGAALSFLIATPETGVDSMAVTYALLDPIMTLFRPIAAFLTAVSAGLLENFFGDTYQDNSEELIPDLACKVDRCCDGVNCPPEIHRHHHSFWEKLRAAVAYGFGDILKDIAGWLLLGIAIAGAISVLVPDDFLKTYLHGGWLSMLIMLGLGIPLYVCATSSTPIAAALILKGVSPGAALVFLLAGPATNAATISVVYGLFRARTTAIYLGSIAVCAMGMGLLLDGLYAWSGLSLQAFIGNEHEFIPHIVSVIGAMILLGLLCYSIGSAWFQQRTPHDHEHACCKHGCSHKA